MERGALCRYTTTSRSLLPSDKHVTQPQWRNPGNKDRKTARCDCGRRRKASNSKRRGKHPMPSGEPGKGELTSHAPPSRVPLLPPTEPTQRLKPTKRSLLCLRLKTFGEGEGNCHLSSCRILSHRALASPTRPGTRPLQGLLSLCLMRLALTTSQKPLSISRTACYASFQARKDSVPA